MRSRQDSMSHVGPKGGRYDLVGGRKIYVRSRMRPGHAKRARAVAGMGAYRKRRSGRRVIHGRGGFWSDFKDWSVKNFRPFERGLTALGEAVGDTFGITGGGALGGRLGKKLGELTGLGDYKVNQNSLMGLVTGGTSAGGVPRVQNIGGRVIVNHREYIKDITASTDFALESFDINPGLRKTFPWLADVAACYEQWRPLGIVLAFETHSADALNSTNTALGSLILSSNYNSTAPEYKTQKEMLNTEYTTSTKPSCSVLHPLECAPSENPQRIFYVRSSTDTPDNSQLWYDLCKTQIATIGMQNSSPMPNIGKLYISYEIEFMKPVLNGLSSGKPIQQAFYKITSPLTAAPLNAATKVFDNIGLTVDGTGITFPEGNPNALWMMQYNVYGTGTAACTMDAPAPEISGDVSLFDFFDNNSESFVPTGTVNTSQFLTNTGLYEAKGEGGIVSFATSGNVFPSGTLVGDLYVTRCNPGIVPSTMAVTSFVDTTQEAVMMSDYEKRLRKFLKQREADDLPIDVKLQIFDRLEAEMSKLKIAEVDDRKESPIRSDYVDLSASQLFAKAVEKAAKK